MQIFFLSLSILFLGISIFSFLKKNTRFPIFTLFLSALFVRFVMISIDPFLHDWDEKFHALVAKNMISHPFRPMLRVDPIFPVDISNWENNEIWLHKPPLFLWQMAFSMHIFGENEWAMRLPSAILGALAVILTWRIAQILTTDHRIAFLAAVLQAFSFNSLELTSGKFGLDHNDLAFHFYITASVWAFSEYTFRQKKRWVVAVGLFAGAAVLVKFLAGMAIFGGWAVWFFYKKFNFENRNAEKNNENRGNSNLIFDFLIAFALACAVFLPWQFYIWRNFPNEAAATFNLYHRHIFEVLDGRNGSIFFYFENFDAMFGAGFLPFIFAGFWFLKSKTNQNRGLSLASFFIFLSFWIFFSVFVKTKMPGLIYPTAWFIWIIAATGMVGLWDILCNFNWFWFKNSKIAVFILIFCSAFYAMRPNDIFLSRTEKNVGRTEKIEASKVFRQLSKPKTKRFILVGCPGDSDKEIMFYQNFQAWNFMPEKSQIERLKLKKFEIAICPKINNSN